MGRNCQVKELMQMRIYEIKFFSAVIKVNLLEEEKKLVC